MYKCRKNESWPFWIPKTHFGSLRLTWVEVPKHKTAPFCCCIILQPSFALFFIVGKIWLLNMNFQGYLYGSTLCFCSTFHCGSQYVVQSSSWASWENTYDRAPGGCISCYLLVLVVLNFAVTRPIFYCISHILIMKYRELPAIKFISSVTWGTNSEHIMPFYT